MCGRFALFSDIHSIIKYSDFLNVINDIEPINDSGFAMNQKSSIPADELAPNYNASPGTMLPVLYRDNDSTRLSLFNWGFIPHFIRDKGKPSYNIINAKSETVDKKGIFKESYLKRRCLIPANGFFEWRVKDKQPYYIRVKEEPLFFFGGIYSKSEEPTFAIITTAANQSISPIHHRMPVIIDKSNLGLWLLSDDVEQLKDLFLPYSEQKMELYQVSKEVNSSRNNYPSLIEQYYDNELPF